MSAPEETPGARLRRERERQGLSLQKAADELRLDTWVIAALEAGDLARVGPTVYAKGHTKRYAQLLGIPPQEVLAGFASLAPAAPAPPPADAQERQPPSWRTLTPPPLRGPLPWMQIGAGAACLAVVLLFWWSPWKHRTAATVAGVPSAASADDPAASSPGDAEPAPPLLMSAAGNPPDAHVTASAAAGGGAATPASYGTSAGASPVAAAGPAGVTAAPGAAPAAAAAQPAAQNAAASDTPGAGHARLRLSFSADSWVDVRDAGGRRVFAGNGRANSVKTVAGMAPLRVYLGYASGVQLEINDHAVAIAPPFLKGDVARFQAGADGVLRSYTSGNARPRG